MVAVTAVTAVAAMAAMAAMPSVVGMPSVTGVFLARLLGTDGAVVFMAGVLRFRTHVILSHNTPWGYLVMPRRHHSREPWRFHEDRVTCRSLRHGPSPTDPTVVETGPMKAPPNDHRTRVLVVDDEKALAGMIANYLDRAGHRVRVEHTGTDAVSAARDWVPDVIVLDLGLPGLDGVEVCRRVRTFSDCMVLMVTARDDETDTLIGLSVGADDYMTKPFSVRELVARVQAVLRRPRTGSTTASGTARSEPTRVFGALRVDPDGQRVHLGDVEVALTPTER